MKNSDQALELFTATGIIRRALAAAGKRGAISIAPRRKKLRRLSSDSANG